MRRLSTVDAAELTETELIEAYQVDDRAVPHLRMNFVTSLDGAVAVDGRSKGLSSKEDQAMLARLRMLSDVVLVGAGTVRVEAYNPLRLAAERREWRRSRGLSDNPVLALVSARLDLDPADRYLAEAPVRPLVITHAAAPPDRRAALAEVADVLVCGDTEVEAAEALAKLAARGLPQVLCEGGPHLFGSLTAADLVDELCLSLSPLLTGPGSGRITAGPVTTTARRLVPRSVLAADDGTLFLRYGRAV
jgi:riboflavin biosynthesis pyrimidine reductase